MTQRRAIRRFRRVETGELIEARGVIASALALGALVAGVTGGTAAVGAGINAHAAGNAADIQSKAAADSLAFQKEQQAIAQREFEQTQRANYDQWAAGEQNTFGTSVAGAQNDRNMALASGHNTYNQYKARDQRVGQLGELLGMARRTTPDFEDPAALVVPDLKIPPYAGPGGSAPTQTTEAPAGNPRDPNFITQQLTGVYKKLGATPTGPGTGPTDIAYMAGKVAETGGWTPANQSYWPTRIAEEIAKAKAKGAYQSNAGALLGAH